MLLQWQFWTSGEDNNSVSILPTPISPILAIASDNRYLLYLFAYLSSFQCKHHIWSPFKKPISLFQLSPHLQWHRPINCCFIFRPQLGQTRLLLICVPPAGWWKRPRRKCHTAGANLAHAPPRLG